MNQTLKNHLTKLILETQLPWTKCLPIALLRIQSAPRKDPGLSPYEMLYGMAYINSTTDHTIVERKDEFLKNYIFCLSSTLFSLRTHGLLMQTFHPLNSQFTNTRPEITSLSKVGRREILIQPEKDLI